MTVPPTESIRAPLVVRRVVGLPLHGWCATVRAAAATVDGQPETDLLVDLLVGELVETGQDWWFAGVWDGPYDERGFADAATVTGTGGQIGSDGVRIVGPTHLFGNMVSIARGDRCVVANSLALALVVADARVDHRHRWYRSDIGRTWRGGIPASPGSLPLAGGVTALVHSGTDLVVRTDPGADRPSGGGLIVDRVEKPNVLDAPRDFDEYRALLAGTVERLVANGAAAERVHPLRAATTISSGYDASAAAVLGAEGGISEAFTMAQREHGPVDDGAELARTVGLAVTVVPRDEWQSDPACPDVEAAASCGGPFRLELAGLAARARGSLVLLGTWGDDLWTRGPLLIDSSLREPLAGMHPAESTHELGVRAGIVFVHVPTIGALHAAAVNAISCSAEMDPWSVPGWYDRPIPRRIVEEAGVPRAAFGTRKTAGVVVAIDRALSAASHADFEAYWAALCQELGLRRALWLRAVAAVGPPTNRFATRVAGRLDKKRQRVRLRQWSFERAPRAAYRFHWAVECLTVRIADALDAAPERAG